MEVSPWFPIKHEWHENILMALFFPSLLSFFVSLLLSLFCPPFKRHFKLRWMLLKL